MLATLRYIIWEVIGKHCTLFFCTLRNSFFHQLYISYTIYICIVWYCYGALLRTSPMNTYVKVSFWLWSFTFGGLKLVESRPKKWLAPRFILLLSFSYHFSFFVLVDKSYEKQKYYVIVFHFRLACLALQMENIVQKITQLKWWTNQKRSYQNM